MIKNSFKALRNSYEKRDRSEDNSTYYNQILRSDEKYADEYETKKMLHRVTKQNGLYINAYDYKSKLIDNYNSKYNDYRNKIGTESFVKSSTENGLNKLEGKQSDLDLYGNLKLKNGRRVKNVDIIRRVSSDFNVSVQKCENDGFGFSVRGDAPVVIASVEPNSLADVSNIIVNITTTFMSCF